MNLIVDKTPSDPSTLYSNHVYVSEQDFVNFDSVYVTINGGNLVYIIRPLSTIVTSGRIAMSHYQRLDSRVSVGKVYKVSPFTNEINAQQSLKISVQILDKLVENVVIVATDFVNHVRNDLHGQILSVGQNWGTMFEGILIKCTVLETACEYPAVLTGDTIIHCTEVGDKFQFVYPNHDEAQQEIFRSGSNWSFEDYDIGGLDEQLSTMFRRAFSSRRFPLLAKKMGTKHIKGIMLFGPPGCGKTMIARQIGKMLNTVEPKIINGPEVLDKYVGESQRKIRDLFAEAEAEYKSKKDKSRLHLIIFDEIDAIAKQRGSDALVGDSMVNQLLAKMDGVEPLDNILIIGMTNRIDMIDDALLRPGRFEVKIEIGLPDQKGREQILRIHTKQMTYSSLLDPGVNLNELAEKTKNYSGAELEGVVKSASTFALSRHLKSLEDRESDQDQLSTSILADDFSRALEEVKPAFGTALEDQIDVKPMVNYGEQFNVLWESCMLFVDRLNKSSRLARINLLLDGPNGAGKTTVAMHLAKVTKFPFVKLVMAHSSEQTTAQKINKAFEDAKKSEFSVIVLDDLQKMIQYVGGRFSNLVLQTLLVNMTESFAKNQANKKLLVIATTSSKHILTELGLVDSFNGNVAVPQLEIQDILTLATYYGFKIDPALKLRYPIKKILFILEVAQSLVDDDGEVYIQAKHIEEALDICL